MGARIYTTRRTIISRGAVDAYANIDGDSQFFYRPDADFPESGITGDMTIQGWINVPNVSGNKIFVSKFLAAGNNSSYMLLISNAELRVYLSADGAATTTVITSAMGLIADHWHHIAMVYDASAGTVDFYKNGNFIEQEVGLPNSIADKAADFIVGWYDTTASYFYGGLFNVALFDDKRTGPEILASANNRQIDLSGEGNIVSQWMFNEAANAVAIDNTQGDAGRDLTPYDGGDVTFGNCGRTTGLLW